MLLFMLLPDIRTWWLAKLGERQLQLQGRQKLRFYKDFTVTHVFSHKQPELLWAEVWI